MFYRKTRILTWQLYTGTREFRTLAITNVINSFVKQLRYYASSDWSIVLPNLYSIVLVNICTPIWQLYAGTRKLSNVAITNVINNFSFHQLRYQ